MIDMMGGTKRLRVVVQDGTLVLRDWDASFGKDESQVKPAGTLVVVQEGDKSGFTAGLR